MKMKQLTVAMITLLLTASCSEKQQDYPFRNPDLPLEERIDDLLSRLTPEEKIGQMMNVTPAIERLGIPTYDWWNEALHGVARAGRATVFPQAIAMAATFDDNAVHETFTMVSDEARAKYHQYQKDKEYDRYKGLTFWTPNINIFRDHIRAPVANIRQCSTATSGDHTGDGKHLAVDSLCPLNQTNDRRELPDLNAANQCRTGTNTWVTGHRASTRIRNQWRDQIRHRILVQQGITIDTDQIFTAGGGGPHTQGNRFTLIMSQMNDAQAWIFSKQRI